MKDDIDHMRTIMSENQKALCSVVTALSSIQEEIRNVNITVKQHLSIYQHHRDIDNQRLQQQQALEKQRKATPIQFSNTGGTNNKTPQVNQIPIGKARTSLSNDETAF